MRRLRGPMRNEMVIDLHLSRGNVPAEESPIEERQGGRGLVERHHMAGLEDARERIVAVFSGIAVMLSIDHKWHVPGLLPFLHAGIFHSVRNNLPAEPVADVIRITVDKGDTDREVQEFIQVVNEVRPGEVACLLEGIVDLVARLGVVEVDPESVLDIRPLEIAIVVECWGGIVLYSG